MLSKHQKGLIAILLGLALGLAWVDSQSSQKSWLYLKQSIPAQESKDNIFRMGADERIAAYTWWLAVLTAALVAASIGQGFFLLRADKTAQSAANAASEANRLTRELFIAEQRPWLLWELPKTVAITNDGRRLLISIQGQLENIGRTPALNIIYFGKLYFPASSTESLTAQNRSENFFNRMNQM
jgi:hypothetical protein